MLRCLSILLICLLPGLGHAQDLTGTLAHIEETGEITIGYRTSRPPISYADSAGLPDGYSVEICRRIAEDVGQTLGRDDLKLSFVPVTAQDRLDAVENGTVDILCGATTKTLSRAEQVGFSQLTFATGGTFLSLDNNRIEGLSDLAGRSVAVLAGTTTEAALTRAIEQSQLSIEVMSVESPEIGLAALADGEVVAYAADQVALLGQVLSQREARAQFYLSSRLFSFEPYALAIKRGDADFALVADRTISRLFRTGEVKAIYNRYFAAYGLKPPSALVALYELMSTPE